MKNSIKPQRVQYIVSYFYYATMQKLSKFETLSSQKIYVIVIKTAHGMSNFSKKLVRNYRFKKKSALKFLW